MAEHFGIKLFRYYLQKIKSFFLSKDILIFLLFFALSAGFWFVHALGKERETTISVPLRYVGVPPNIDITNNPPAVISLSVHDQGLQLLGYSRNGLHPMSIDLSRTFYQKGDIVITADQLAGRLRRYLKPTTSILELHPDSILIQYEKLSTTVLPITLNAKIEPAHQHIIHGHIQLHPSQLTVFGPKKLIESLKSISTEFIDLSNITDTATYVFKLKPIKSVRYSSKNIKVTICAEQFTEKKIQIPIQVLHCPVNFKLRTFPPVVEATFTVGLSHFNSFNPTDIQVYLDYNDIQKVNVTKQKLNIINGSKYISNLRISPQEVEFILEPTH